MSAAPRKVLILCVDRDADIEVVTRRRTPIIGRDKVLAAAVDFAIKSPEDSDANALFAAVQMYDTLRESFGSENLEIAVLAGTPSEGLEADIKILNELEQVLKIFNAEGVVLVSDGPTDEQILPVIQSKIPVISVKRIIVQQSRGVEETFLMLTRYIEKLFREEKYRKYSLGIPGVLVLLYALFQALNIELTYVLHISLAIMGFVLVIKGFSIDEKIKSVYTHHPVTFTSLVASIIIIWVASAVATAKITELNQPPSIRLVSQLLLSEISGPITLLDLFLFSIILIIIGRIGDQVISLGLGKVSWRYYVFLTFTILSRPVFIEGIKVTIGMGDIFYLFYWTTITLIVSSLVGGFFVLREKLKSS